MNSQALVESFSEFKDLKSIDRPTMMKVLEDVFRTLIRRKYTTDENFDIIVNTEKGDLEIWRRRTIVEDGKVEDPNQQIELSEAQTIEPDYQVGEEAMEEVNILQEFGPPLHPHGQANTRLPRSGTGERRNFQKVSGPGGRNREW